MLLPPPEDAPAGGGRARGRWLVVAGPDGVGKTTLAHALLEALGPARALHVHHRFGVLPRSAANRRPTTEPHAVPPYPRWLAGLKVAYLYLDHVFGWVTRVQPARRSGRWVVHERGWLDIAVDPRRYRLEGVGGLVSLLTRVAPRPDLTLVLDAPAAVMHARAPELGLEELERQRLAWRTLAPRHGPTRWLDSREPVEQLVVAALAAFDPARAGATRWARLPPLGRARWTIPVWPPRVALAALAVYQPMTPHGLLGWSAARVVARCGGLVPFGRREPPPEQAALVPRTQADAVVAVASGTRPGRSVALVIDRGGVAVALAKRRTDPGGPAALAREAEMVARFGPLLPAGTVAPRILSEEDGMLVFEPASWRPRLRPWLLPMPVAAALGTFYRAAGGGPLGGPAHGDCAPWNLMRVEGGWMLLDWADATLEATPFLDPLHYLVQAHALLGRPSAATIVEGLAGAGWIGEALRAYATAAGLDPAAARQCCLDYLTGSLPTMDLARADGRRGAVARRRLLAALAARPMPWGSAS